MSASFALCSSVLLNAEIITFADANVKAICLANWDVDHDGELSTEEAAAVTSLGTVFKDKSNIGCFPELKYFTGLTAISEYAFSGSSIGPEIVVPGNVKRLEARCFFDCQQLERVILKEGVEYIGVKVFSGPISFLSLPISIKEISSMAINPYVNAYSESGVFIPKGDLTVQVQSLEPAAINDYAFYYVVDDGHLIVPFGSITAYKAIEGWSHFHEYLQAGDVNGDGQLNVKDVVSMNAYIMKNNPSPFDQRLADLNGDGEINVKDITLMCTWIMQQGQ